MHFAAILDLLLVAWFIGLAGVEFIGARSRGSPEMAGDARLITNFGLGALALVADTLIPSVKVGFSLLSPWVGTGLTGLFSLPWAAALLTFLLLDSLATYWLHRLMHANPVLWRLHRVHHADAQVDVSTSLRNHPLELLATVPLSVIVIVAVGAPATAVIAAQTIVVAASIWQHADIQLPRAERLLRTLLVTPSIHRVHHSPDRRLHDSNFGDLIIFWDRLFGSYNPGSGRGRVGLEGRVGRAHGLIQQIWSPVHGA